jgi:cellulose synthase/poly-beta-1,6-N-acetylglucosamine synthase-like glycosyltransferase
MLLRNELLFTINIFLFAFSLLGIVLVFVLYPLGLFIVSLFVRKRHPTPREKSPKLSLVIAVYNAERMIDEKIQNSLSLRYPKEKLEIIFSSDGSTDRTEKIIDTYKGLGVNLFSSPFHEGKADALNRAVEGCSGEIIIFTDADALLSPDSLDHILIHYDDPKIGGVCGQRVIYKEESDLRSAQKHYIRFDSTIKLLESRIGSITSNDGKIYSIRRKLFQPIETAVTDDLYTCLSIIRQGYRFIFEPEARAYIRLPSRNPSHEVQRRRRIVSRSLRGLWLMGGVLNPFRYGLYSIGLIINKVLRRVLPIFFIFLFLSSGVLGLYNLWIRLIWFLQLGGYTLAFFYPLSLKTSEELKYFRKVASIAYYFCVGNYGTLLGLLDFLSGRKVTKWEPVKTDASPQSSSGGKG